MSFITKSALRTGIALSVAFLGGFSFVSAATAAPLEVTSIENVRVAALPGSTFENGLSWKFSITLPEDEPSVIIAFPNLVDGSKVVDIKDNARFTSLQGAAVVNGYDHDDDVWYQYSRFEIDPSQDLNPSFDGIQIQITADVKLSATSTPGSYSFEYIVASESIRTVDTVAPKIAPHAPVVVEATSANGAEVTFDLPVVTDNRDIDIIAKCSPISGSLFPLNSTTVECNAADAAGNPAETTYFEVTVVDTTAPVISAHSNITVEATTAAGAVATYSAPTATDTIDGNVAVTCSPISGSIFPIGNTTVNCSATDLSGNTAQSTFIVTVQDTTAPVATLLGPSERTILVGGDNGNYIDEKASGYDSVDGDLPVNNIRISITSSLPGVTALDIYTPATYYITFWFIDNAGNESNQVTRTVIVQDVPTVTHTITTTLTGNGGSVTPSALVNAPEGQNQSITIIPDAGYAISQLLVDGVSTAFFYNNETRNDFVGRPLDGNYTHTFSNVSSAHVITATFVAQSEEPLYQSLVRVIREELEAIEAARQRVESNPNIQSAIDEYQPVIDAGIAVRDNPSSTRRDVLDAVYDIFDGGFIFYGQIF